MKRKLPTYGEIDPDTVITKANQVYVEATELETLAAMERKRKVTAQFLKFYQDNGLTTAILYDEPLDIPPDFEIKLRDITPEGLEMYRTGAQKWYQRFERNMHADPSDVKVLEKSLKLIREKASKDDA